MTFKWLEERFNRHVYGNVGPTLILMGAEAYEAFRELAMLRQGTQVPILRFKNAIVDHAPARAHPWSVVFLGGGVVYRADRTDES